MRTIRRTTQKQGYVFPHRCPTCINMILNIEEFRNQCSRQEYLLSGMCQRCQDAIFSEPIDGEDIL